MKKPGLKWKTSSAASFKAQFDIVQTRDCPEPIGPVRPDAGEVHDPGNAIDSYRPGDGVGSLSVHARTFGAAKLAGVSQKRTSVPSVALERAAASSDEA